jgi:hypothetical protein
MATYGNASDIGAQLLDGTPHSPSVVPPSPGFYAWWCRREHLADASPAFPYEPRPPVPEDWSLLYVGISPSSATSTRHLAARLMRNHATGNIGSSTFRLSIASFLHLGLDLKPRTGGDRARLESEKPLTQWVERSCAVTFAVVEQPWLYEAAVIEQLKPPLNLDRSSHPFKATVQLQRAALRKVCGC